MKPTISAICSAQHLDYALRTRATRKGDGKWGKGKGKKMKPGRVFLQMFKHFRPLCKLITRRGIVHNDTVPSLEHNCK